MTRRSTLYAILAPLTAFLTVFWYGYRYVHPLLLPFTGAALGAALITALLGWRKEALRLTGRCSCRCCARAWATGPR